MGLFNWFRRSHTYEVPANIEFIRETILNDHIFYRMGKNISAISPDKTLDGLAQTHAESMAKSRRMSHDGFAVRCRKAGGFCGENVAMGQTPEGVTNAWVRSPAHRNNILNSSYARMGIGVAISGGATYYCVMFSR